MKKRVRVADHRRDTTCLVAITRHSSATLFGARRFLRSRKGPIATFLEGGNAPLMFPVHIKGLKGDNGSAPGAGIQRSCSDEVASSPIKLMLRVDEALMTLCVSIRVYTGTTAEMIGRRPRPSNGGLMTGTSPRIINSQHG
ncbi:hypothetical protein Ddc_06636 [Ditylenchus destructor]|nr:hypothetical protein Ddc_06636 [Ditylenchus destructor]